MEGNDKSNSLENYQFSFNVKVEDVESDNSSDSETNGLQIDVAEVDNYDSNNKRNKRIESIPEALDGLGEMEEEIERQLDAKAAKTNLTATNVKNLLRHVITNEHVMAMVQRRLNKNTDDDGIVFEPKLTRSKAKELGALGQPNIPWPTTPVKTAFAEVQVLIEEELPEDSSDEEYDPDQDQQSDDDKEGDDDKEADNSIGSDVDSQPSTPATPHNDSFSQDTKCSIDIHYDSEGLFKIPEVPNVKTEEENIGQRTRSKLCLSETPLEYIEQAFIPPDITTDMYDHGGEMDEDWKGFLQDFTQPLTQEVNVEDDPEADPEYNFLEEDETELLDKEEWRMDRAVKVSRKEVNNLMDELLEYANEYTSTQSNEKQTENQETTKKRKSTEFVNTPTEIVNTPTEFANASTEYVNTSQEFVNPPTEFPTTTMEFVNAPSNFVNTSTEFANTNANIVNTVTVNNPLNASVELIPVLSVTNLPTLVNNEQFQLLKTQMRQHVQLMTQQFLMCYKHPEHYKSAKTCKSNIECLRYLSSGPDSVFNIENLPYALEVINECEEMFKDEKFCEEYANFLAQDIKIGASKTRRIHTYKFHPAMEKLMAKSKALTYPNLLPHVYTRSGSNNRACRSFFKSEENLLALGLEQFNIFELAREDKIYKTKTELLSEVISKIRKYILPTRDYDSILNLIRKYKNPYTDSPVRHYLSTGKAPMTIHVITLDFELKAPRENDIALLPEMWKKYSKFYMNPPKSNEYHKIDRENFVKIEIDYNPGEHLRNPIVNMMPSVNITKQEIPEEQETEKEIEFPPHTSEEMIVPEIMDVDTNIEIEEPTNENEKRKLRRTTQRLMKTHNTQDVRPIIKVFTSDPEEMIIPEIMDVDTNVEMEIQENENQKPLPQLRKTTPRLAKMRSAQNIKAMTQVVTGKEVSSGAIKTKSKTTDSSKGSDVSSSSSVKGDNEDEIAELMRASTTIKKNAVNRKKAKQVREMENIKRMIDSENELNAEERATKFAASYLQKLHSNLESSDPETFKAIIKLFLEYSEKLDNIIQTENDNELKTDGGKTPSTSIERKSKLNDLPGVKDMVAINFYRDVCDKLENYPDMSSDFLLFLNSYQAGMVNKSLEWMMLQRMQEFVQVAQTYFAKQPSRLTKVMQSISQLASAPYTPLKSVYDAISPILKGSPIVMDLFLQVFPMGKPPESLFAPQFFENITCPVGPHDKSKSSTLDLPDLYENIELPVSTNQEDPYGGENCKCNCHDATDSKLKSGNEHCASCGTRFLNGRIYLQTSEGLRPAKITFPGENDEKLENIARVSLKPAEKLVQAPPPQKRRRKSSKHDSTPDDNAKPSAAFKVSPIKEAITEEIGEKLVTKPKRGPRSPPKAAHPSTSGINRKTIFIGKKKREQRAEERDAKPNAKVMENFPDDDDGNPVVDKMFVKTKKLSESSDSDGSICCEMEKPLETRPWSRQEDAILLQNIKKEYSEKCFNNISQALENRTVQQVKDRCQLLLTLLEKIS